MDWSELRDLIWEARWDALVMLARGMWAVVLVQPWIAVIFVLLLITASRKTWLRFLRFVGMTLWRGELRD